MKKDILFSAILGLIAGLFLVPTLSNTDITLPVSSLVVIIGMPILCAAGIIIARTIGKYVGLIHQLGKFCLIGGTNLLIDLGILNILISASGLSSGVAYVFYKAIGFVVAVVNSYFWNKKWTFGDSSQNQAGSFLKFVLVSAFALLINVGVASGIVNLIDPAFGLDAKQWANIGAVAGSIAGLAWNFLGYKFVVFSRG